MEQRLPWIDTAISLIGTYEAPGAKNNPTILSWAKKIGGWVGSYYKQDSIPWCGLFVGHCLKENGFEVKQNLLSARSWNTYGKKLTEPYYGCIVVFSRQGGGHVGFAVSQDKDTIHVLGGNQSDSVNITKISKSRLLGYRWPDYHKLPMVKLPVRKFDGKISTNEE